MQFSFLLAALAISASAAPTPQLNAQVLNDVVDVNSDNLAGLSTLLGGLGVTAGTDDAPLKVLTPIGPGASGPSLPGTKTKRQLNAQVLNDLVDVNSDNLAGLSAVLGGLGVTLGTDDAPLKVLTPLGPGAPSLPGTKREAEAEEKNA